MKFKTTLLVLANIGFFVSPASAAVNLTHGDLAIGFYQVISGVVQSNTYVFDLGLAADYRETAAYYQSVTTIASGPASGNIGADLVATFGADWYSSNTVRWIVVGNVGQTDPLTGGDPARTSYFSKAASTIPSGGGVSTTIPTVSATNRGGLSNAIEPFFDNTSIATQTVGANPAGSIIGISNFGSLDEYVVPTVSTNFSLSNSVVQTQTFGPGNISGFEGALDIYRMIDTTVGADLTAINSTTDASVGTGQFVTKLVIDSSGNLLLIPEPSAAALGLVGALGFILRRRRNA
jgi:hypothetical protein